MAVQFGGSDLKRWFGVMGVDSQGILHVAGEDGPGLGVRVQVDDGVLKLTAGDEVVGDWIVSNIGVRDLNEGFALRIEGEDLVLILDDEVGFAEEIGLAAATPRLARKLAAAHNPEPRELPEDPEPVSPATSRRTAALGLALAGVMVVLGGSFIRVLPTSALSSDAADSGSVARFWLPFAVGGLLMVAVAWLLSIGRSWARFIGILVVAGVILLFGYVVSTNEPNSSHVPAYGFIAGGIVVGVAVMFGGSLRPSD